MSTETYEETANLLRACAITDPRKALEIALQKIDTLEFCHESDKKLFNEAFSGFLEADHKLKTIKTMCVQSNAHLAQMILSVIG